MSQTTNHKYMTEKLINLYIKNSTVMKYNKMWEKRNRYTAAKFLAQPLAKAATSWPSNNHISIHKWPIKIDTKTWQQDNVSNERTRTTKNIYDMKRKNGSYEQIEA